jgi:hypothetical protein
MARQRTVQVQTDRKAQWRTLVLLVLGAAVLAVIMSTEGRPDRLEPEPRAVDSRWDALIGHAKRILDTNPTPMRGTKPNLALNASPAASESPSPTQAAAAVGVPTWSLEGRSGKEILDAWHRVWDPIVASDPADQCLTKEYLHAHVTTPRVDKLCSAPTGEVVCKRTENAPIKYCKLTGVSFDLSGPWLVPPCKVPSSKDITNNADQFMRVDRPAAYAVPESAREWLVVMGRDCGPPRNNPYHCSSDVWNSFLAVRDAGIDPKDVRVVFTDRQIVGVYEPYWRSIGWKGVHSATEWSQMVQSQAVSHQSVAGVLIPIRGPAGPLWDRFWAFSDCFRVSPLVMELRSLVHSRVLSVSPSQSVRAVRSRFTADCDYPAVDGPIVTIASRKPSQSVQTMQRQMANEEELLNRLATELPKGVRVQRKDFAEYQWAEQVALARNTTVLVGMHGAALVWSMFLEPGGGVLEMHEPMDPNAPPKGISNLAIHAGHAHMRWRAKGARAPPQGTVVDVTFATKAVAQGLEEARRFCKVLRAFEQENGELDRSLDRIAPLPAQPRWIPHRFIDKLPQ